MRSHSVGLPVLPIARPDTPRGGLYEQDIDPVRLEQNSATSSLMDWAARFLVIATGLSLNDVFSRGFGVGQVATPAMFAASLVLLMNINAKIIALPGLLFFGMIATYVGIGLGFSVSAGTVETAMRYVYSFSASAVIVLGLVNYLVNAKSQARVFRFLRFVRNVFLISASLTLATPLLEKLLTHTTYVADGRFRGVFSNPNEAAYLSLFAWILCVILPFRDRRIQTLALTLIVVSVVVTLSKGAIVTLLLLIAYKSFDLRHPRRTSLLVLLLGFAVVFIQNIQFIASQLGRQYSSMLSGPQYARVLEVVGILSGQIDAETTTGRTYLWKFSVDRFVELFPGSGGLGSFHFLEGGILENGIWQGSHNLYLMLLGESGPIPLLLFLATIGVCIFKAASFTGRTREFLMLIWAIIIINGMAGHSGLEIRYILLIWAVVLGLTIRFDQARQNAPARGARPIRPQRVGRFDGNGRSTRIPPRGS